MIIRSRLITAGLVTFVVAFILFFPARVAYRWFAPEIISLAGISGTVWSGNAREAETNGVYVRNLAWRMQPLTLLTGKLGFAIEASPTSGFFDARFGLGISGKVTLTDVKTSLELRSLQQVVGVPGLGGKMNAQFDRLIIDAGSPVAADGVIEIADLVMPIAAPAMQILSHHQRRTIS